jgi:hypothetical protein
MGTRRIVPAARWLAAGLPLLLAFAVHLGRAYRMTAVNAGFILSYGAWSRWLAILAWLGAIVASIWLRGRARQLAALSACLIAVVAWHLWRHEIVIDAEGVRATSLGASRGLTWREIERDGSDAGLLRLEGRTTSLAVDLNRLAPQDAAAVRRSIARRIEDAAPRPAATPSL